MKKNFDFNCTITIGEFIEHYFKTVHPCNNLKHKGLKSFGNQFIVGVSNDFALNNPDCVARGEVIVVIDDYGNPGTYLNPQYLQKLTDLESLKKTLKLIEKIKLHELNNIKKLFDEYASALQEYEILDRCYSSYYEILKIVEKDDLIAEIRGNQLLKKRGDVI